MQIRGIISALSRRITHIYLVRVPNWHELEKLSKEDKIEVIALLSMSITNAEEIKAPADRTTEMIERCCGWSLWISSATLGNFE